MDSKKAVYAYYRNLAIVIGLLLLIFALIPTMVKSPYILNIFVLVYGVESFGRNDWSEFPWPCSLYGFGGICLLLVGSEDGSKSLAGRPVWHACGRTGCRYCLLSVFHFAGALFYSGFHRFR